MTKQKIDFAKYADMHKEEEIIGNDGTTVTVRDHIPAADKIEFAREYTEQVVMIHDDSCCYRNYNDGLYEMFMIARFYTNIDTEGATPEEVADFIVNNGLWLEVMRIIQDDYDVTDWMCRYMVDMIMTTYADDVSIAKAVRTSFGFLFNGEDITESMAKAEMTKDVIYKAFNALQEKEQEEAKKITDGKATIGGKLLNFTRKQQ